MVGCFLTFCKIQIPGIVPTDFIFFGDGGSLGNSKNFDKRGTGEMTKLFWPLRFLKKFKLFSFKVLLFSIVVKNICKLIGGGGGDGP